MFSAPEPGCEVVAQLSVLYSKRISRNQEGGSVSPPSNMLAIAAMAFQHQDRFGLKFVANCAAPAPASDWQFQSSSPLYECDSINATQERTGKPNRGCVGQGVDLCAFSKVIRIGLYYFASTSGSMIPNTLPAGSCA